MKLKELLGDKYREGMTVDEADAIEGINFANLASGEYVSKAKYKDDLKELEKYKASSEGKQAEIDKAVEEAIKATKTEMETKFNNEKTAEQRKRAREKAYDGLSDEQKSLLDALIKDEDLKLSEDGNTFSNWDETTKPIKEKYKSLFPNDPDGSKRQAGLGNGSDPGLPINQSVLDLAREAAGLSIKK